MKRVTIIITLLTVVCSLTYGQSVSDSISVKKVFGGYQFYQGDKKLDINQLVSTMQSNEQAYQQIKSAKTKHTIATIMCGVGGFLIGWPIGAALGGGEPNWTMAGIGGGIIVVSIPIVKSCNKKSIQAVETYNSGLRTSSFWDKNKLKLSFTENGIGLTLNF